MTDDPQNLSQDAATPIRSGDGGDAGSTFTEVLSQGGFKTVEAQRKLLRGAGVRAEVICPPGVNLNG